jgi:hypothetical protein
MKRNKLIKKFKNYSKYYKKTILESKSVRLEPLNHETHSKDLFEAYDYDKTIFKYINYKPPTNIKEFTEIVINDVKKNNL